MLLNRSMWLLAALPILLSSTAHAQGREITIDVRPFSADLGIAWPVSPGHLLGVSVGGGADDFNHTFRPEIVDTIAEFVTLEQVVRTGAYYRYVSGARFSADLGLRFALGGVRGTSGSVDAVGGLHAALFYGGRRVRVGPRLIVGTSTEHDVGTIIHVEWLTARWRIPF